MKLEFDESQREKKLFILGATGFIGSAVTKRLINLGFKNINCLYRNENLKEKIFSGVDTSAITFLHANVSQSEVLKQGIEGADVVLNVSGAATDWGIKSEVWEVNVSTPKYIVSTIEEMKSATHYIQITSASVYGFSKYQKSENSPLVKTDRFYTASKIELHSWLREEMRKSHSFPITLLAPTIVWGTGDRVYIPIIKERLKSNQIFYFTKTDAIDFVYIDDLVDAILLCFFNGQAYNQEYIISGPTPFTFEEYIAKIAEFSGLLTPKTRMPIWLALLLAFIMENSARFINLYNPLYRPKITRLQVRLLSTPIKVSIDKAKRELRYSPEVDFAKGVNEIKEYVHGL